MAHEHVLVVETAPPIAWTVGNATAIEKGALLKGADLMTASAAAGLNDMAAGVAASEKIASDGKLRLGVYREGIFRGYASGSIAFGDPVGSIASPFTNFLASNRLTFGLSGSNVFGVALEDATNGHTFLWELRPTVQSAQQIT